MPFPPLRSRQRPVPNVANQDVLEGELDVALELAGGNAPDEVPRLERLEQGVDLIELADHPHHLPPERLADHRGIEEAPTDRWRKRIDAGGDRCSDRGGQLRVIDTLGERGRQLLEEQGVSLGQAHDALDGRSGDLFPQRMGSDRGRVGGGQGLEGDRRVREVARAPRRPNVEQLGPS